MGLPCLPMECMWAGQVGGFDVVQMIKSMTGMSCLEEESARFAQHCAESCYMISSFNESLRA
jgi:hypothetical protein